MTNAGCARPFKRTSTLDGILTSEFYGLPYTRKQLKLAPYIGDFKDMLEELFQNADSIQPFEKYDGILKQTFGPASSICKIYEEKAVDPKFTPNKAELYIDFEAMNMRICGWYAQLIDGDNILEFSGTAKPFSDERRLRWLWKTTYQKMLDYSIEDIIRSRHIHGYRGYFMDLFKRARHIYTYGDTDALFLKYSFGEEMYNFFRVKNVDVSVHMGNRTLSLDKTCKLLDIHVEGGDHDPRTDVIKMMKYMQKVKEL